MPLFLKFIQYISARYPLKASPIPPLLAIVSLHPFHIGAGSTQLFHNNSLSVLGRMHFSDWTWGPMKASGSILFAEDSKHPFQNQKSFIIVVKYTVSAFLHQNGKINLPYISMQVAVPLSEHNMIYLPSHMGWQKCLSQHAGALAMSFSTTVKKISADIDDF